jgi:hypothetical protein
MALSDGGTTLNPVASTENAAESDGRAPDKAIVPGGFNGNMEYTGGPNVCGDCHTGALDDWLTHGHSRKIALAWELGAIVDWAHVGDRGHTAHARSAAIPLPTHDTDVYNWDNVLMVVGASKHWKSRFVDQQGYFITRNGANQYNWATGEWVDYHADEVDKPFDCGSCHTTGYRPEGTAFAPSYPGIVGDFSHVNITCEACHGPGAAHAAAPSSGNIQVDTTAAACGACHTRGDDDMVALASGGFIRHHEQYPELLNSPHSFLGCVSCHSAHVGRAEGVTTECESCHSGAAEDFSGSSMEMAGVDCKDCHMGRATKSARANGPYEGDVWTHIFRIDNGADYDMFNRDGEGNTTSAKDAISLEFACFRCHADADKAAYAAIGDSGSAYHTLGKGK